MRTFLAAVEKANDDRFRSNRKLHDLLETAFSENWPIAHDHIEKITKLLCEIISQGDRELTSALRRSCKGPLRWGAMRATASRRCGPYRNSPTPARRFARRVAPRPPSTISGDDQARRALQRAPARQKNVADPFSHRRLLFRRRPKSSSDGVQRLRGDLGPFRRQSEIAEAGSDRLPRGQAPGDPLFDSRGPFGVAVLLVEKQPAEGDQRIRRVARRVYD
ncbi:hypothetical protein [Methylocella sp.]|uniref:hypothetical protein n=1 Tax=Methylocella sp. TaxID=1978226 RepID=UPI003C2528C8